MKIPAVYSFLVGTYTEYHSADIQASSPFASEGIYSLSYDGTQLIFSHPKLAVKTDNPSYGALNSQANHYYSVNELSQGQVSAFDLSAESATLSLINSLSSGGSYPCYIAISPDKSHLAVANYGDGSISIYTLDQATGTIVEKIAHNQHSGKSINAERQNGPHAHWINWTPDGERIYVVDLGIDKVILYERENNWQQGREALQLKPGSGPRHLLFNPQGNIGYILNELSNTVTTVQVKQDGTLSLIQTLSTLPDDFSGESQGGHIAITSDAKFLYTSNRGHDSLAVFAVQENGTLNKIQTIPTGGDWPRFFHITSDQKRVFVANQYSHSIVAFAISTSGHLVQEGTPAVIPQPVYLQAIN